MPVNPVFRKDLAGLLHLKRLAAIQAIYVVALIAVVKAAPVEKSGVLLAGLIVGQLGLLVLIIPALAAVSVTVEKEEQTLEMLCASRLTAWQIVFGKALSAAAYPIILIISSLPFVIFAGRHARVDGLELSLVYLILSLAALMFAMVCLATSACCRQTATALVAGYLLTLGLGVGVLAPTVAGMHGAVTHHLAALSPVAAELSLLRPDLPEDYSGLASGRAPDHLLFIPLSLAVIVLCVGVAVIRLERPSSEQTLPLARQGWLLRVFCGLLIVSLIIAALARGGLTQDPRRVTRLAQFLVLLQIGAAAAVGTGISAAAISMEVERGTFEMLRASRVSEDWIFWTRLLPAIACGLMTIAAMSPAYAVLDYFSPDYGNYFLRLLPVAAGTALLGGVMGMVCSCFFRSTARATVAAFSIMACLTLIPLIARLGQQAGLVDLGGWADKAAITSPLVIGLTLHPHIDPAMDAAWGRHLLWVVVFSLCWLLVARLRLGMKMRNG